MPIALYPGMRICQISFERLSSKEELPYGHPTRNSKYQNQQGATSSKIHLDRELRGKKNLKL
jgi:dCTP deaminase